MEGGREEASQSKLAMEGEQDVLVGERPPRCSAQSCGQHGLEHGLPANDFSGCGKAGEKKPFALLPREGIWVLRTRPKGNEMIEIEESSSNVYADLGMTDADEMIVKAQLATKIGEIIKGRKWSRQRAADVLGMTQPKLSKMLRGQFRGVSETKMLDCLVRLGHDVKIVVGPVRHAPSAGHVAVEFAS